MRIIERCLKACLCEFAVFFGNGLLADFLEEENSYAWVGKSFISIER
jgi:hypothetical protein